MEAGGIFTLLTALTALVSGVVLTFAAMVVKNAIADKDWWRDKGFVVLSDLKDVAAEMVKRDLERDARLEAIERRQIERTARSERIDKRSEDIDERLKRVDERLQIIEEKAALAAERAEQLAVRFLKEDESG